MTKLLSVLLAIVLFGNALAEQSSSSLEGAWVLYEGGDVAPEVIVFMSGGHGLCYKLIDSYISDSWVWEHHIKNEYLTSPKEFSWTIESIEKNPSCIVCFSLIIQIDELVQEYDAEFIPDMSGTGLDGMVLTVENGAGGGWLKVDFIP